MKLIIPKYASDFKCIGGACADNCCIGWEINIDTKTRDKYRLIGGELGERLSREIEDTDEGAHFRLSGERCPFLNSDNLCDIIIEKGDGYLCEICREHPRYYTVLGDRAFSGVGLSCEAAARLILSECDGHEYMESEACDIEPEACDDELFALIMPIKQTIIDILYDKTITFPQRLKIIAKETEALQAKIDDSDGIEFTCDEHYTAESILELFSSLEYLEDGFLPEIREKLLGLSCGEAATLTNEKYLINLLGYFVDRYLPRAVLDGDALGKMTLAFLSVFIISQLLPENASLDLTVEISREYSKEIEYNEENVDKIEAMAYRGLWRGLRRLLIDIT